MARPRLAVAHSSHVAARSQKDDGEESVNASGSEDNEGAVDAYEDDEDDDYADNYFDNGEDADDVEPTGGGEGEYE